MINPKPVIIIAAAGFILSFFIGIISGISFGIAVLRAFLTAFVFAVIAFGASFVFRKFLADDSVQIAAEPAENTRSGSVVDITIGDEALPEEEDGPDFFVSDELSGAASKSRTAEKSVPGQRASEPSQSAAVSGTAPEQNSRGQNRSSSEFAGMPQQRVQDVKNNTSTAAQENTAFEKEQFRPVQLGTAVQSGAEVSDLDVLPDIGDLVMGEGSGQSSIREDTDFAAGISDTQSPSSGSSAASGVMDTETIAKAIRTALAKDS